MTGSTEIGPMVAVRQFVEGFNNDDVDLAVIHEHVVDIEQDATHRTAADGRPG